MSSPGKREWFNGVFDPDVDELVPGLYRSHDDPGCQDENEGGVDTDVSDLSLPDLTVVVVDDTLHHVEDRLRHVIHVQCGFDARVEMDDDRLQFACEDRLLPPLPRLCL